MNFVNKILIFHILTFDFLFFICVIHFDIVASDVLFHLIFNLIEFLFFRQYGFVFDHQHILELSNEIIFPHNFNFELLNFNLSFIERVQCLNSILLIFNLWIFKFFNLIFELFFLTFNFISEIIRHFFLLGNCCLRTQKKMIKLIN